MHKIPCNYLAMFCYFPFGYSLRQLVGHFCTEQKVVITILFQINSYIQKVWQTTSLQKFTLMHFKYLLVYAYTYYILYLYLLVIKLKLKYNKVCIYISDKIEAEIR